MKATRAQRAVITAVADAVGANGGQPVGLGAIAGAPGITKGGLYAVLVRCLERGFLVWTTSGRSLFTTHPDGLSQIGRST